MTNGVVTTVQTILLPRRMCITMVHPIVDDVKGGNHLCLQILHQLHPLLTRDLLLQRGLLEDAIDTHMWLGNGLKSCKHSKKELKVLPF